MSSIGVKLPLSRDSVDGFLMIKSVSDAIKQNFKMLIMTNPGERVMEPNFGVGLHGLLFSGYQEGVETIIRDRISEQTKMYIPSIEIVSTQFGYSRDVNTLNVIILYKIPRLGVEDSVQITI